MRDRKNDKHASEVPAPSHIVEDQGEVFAFLGDRRTHGIGEPVKRIDTHGAAVFLAGKDAYKVKRAVRFPFMDFSSIAKRKAACEAEIEINRPGAPSIYIGTLPVVRRNGALHLGGEGEIVEWVVHMRRFDETLTLDQIADRGMLSADLICRVSSAVTEAHQRAELRPAVDFAAALGRLIDENGESLHETPDIFERERVADLTRLSRHTLERHAAILAARANEGQVRRCHGDLHLRNIVLIDGRPTLFDAIEFDEALATTDLLYDLAFLLMDLAERGLRFEANLLFNRYLVESRDDRQLAGLGVLPLLISVRAAIRAKVIAAALGFSGKSRDVSLVRDARRYFSFAETALRPVQPRLVAVGGLSGTGKSTLAAGLAPALLPVPGAVHLRSDVIRKQLLGAPELEPLPPSAYDLATTDAVYAALRRKAEQVLKSGLSVIVDAVHQRADERQALADLAGRLGVPLTGIWLQAPVEVLAGRVEARRGDASDADATIVAMQAKRSSEVDDWQHIDASRASASVLQDARAAVGAPHPAGMDVGALGG